MLTLNFGPAGANPIGDLVRRQAWHEYRRDHEPLGSAAYRRWEKRAGRCRRLVLKLARRAGE